MNQHLTAQSDAMMDWVLSDARRLGKVTCSMVMIGTEGDLTPGQGPASGLIPTNLDTDLGV